MAGAKLHGPDIGRRVLKIAQAVEKGRADTVKAAAEQAKAEQLAVMRADSGGDLVLSGVNRRKGRPGGAKIGAKHRVRSSGMTTTAYVSATGPLQIINNDTSGHVVRSAWGAGTRGSKGTRGFVGPVLPGQFAGGGRGGKAVLNIPGVGFRRSARHPGTKGKDTWRRGQAEAEPVVARTMRKTTTLTIAKGMKP